MSGDGLKVTEPVLSQHLDEDLNNKPPLSPVDLWLESPGFQAG